MVVYLLTTCSFESVVHVVGALSSQQAILDLDDLLPQASEKREMHFFVNIDILLNNDAEFTEESVVAEAHRLLSGLEHFQHSDAEVRIFNVSLTLASLNAFLA